jgi:transglutaminase-like putative cysteine protease
MKRFKLIIESVIVFLFVISVAQTFLSLSSFENSTPIFAFIISVIALLQLVKNKIYKFSGIFVSLLLMMYFYLQREQSFYAWLSVIFEDLRIAIAFMINESVLFIPHELGVLLLGIFLIIILILTITFKKWKLAFLLQLAYYLILIGLNQVRVANHVLLFAFASFILAAWQLLQQSEPTKQSYKTILTLTLVVSVMIIGSYQIPNSLPITYQTIQTQTTELRRELTDSLFRTLERLGDSTGITLQSGFSENDSYLGGPMTLSRRVVYETIQNQPTYWRIESKELYTSKGWETRTLPNQMIRTPFNVDFGFENYSSQIETIRFSTSRESITFIPIPYGKVTINFSENFYRLNSAFYENTNHRIRTDNLRKDELIDVIIQYQRPIYYEQQLINSRASTTNPANPYTQLPDSLPQRVIDLAFTITRNARNDYEKVKMIEAYLRDPSNFTYTLTDAEFVPFDRDYVDFFLFDTKKGYCEQFSSAMTIMLRALNIQARWVKGYSPGEQSSIQLSSSSEYRVIEANAHAWVEVYFENVGWIPFEPTPTFSLSTEAPSTPINDRGEIIDSTNPNNPINPLNPDEIPFEDEAANLPNAGGPTQGNEDGIDFDITRPTLIESDNFFWMIMGGLLLVLGVFIYLIRSYLSLLVIKYRFNNEQPTTLKPLFILMFKALNITYRKDQSDTILEYVTRLDWLDQQHKLILLSKQTEAMFYGNSADVMIEKDHITLFNNIIDQCLATVKKQIITQLSPTPVFRSSGLVRFIKR